MDTTDSRNPWNVEEMEESRRAADARGIPHEKVERGNGVAVLWRFYPPLGCYAAVFKSEDASVEDRLRRATMTRSGEGRMVGCHFYTRG